MRTRDKRKERLIREQALAMVVEQGFDGLSMQKLARAAGVSPATIYIYFRDRDDLLLKLYCEEMKKMSDVTLEGFDPAMSFEEGLKVQWINRAKYCLEHPVEAHFMEQMRFSPLHDRAVEGADPSFFNAMRSFVVNAIKKKQLIHIPVEVFWAVAYAPLYQLVKFHKQGGMPGLGKFTLDKKTMLLTLDLVLKALKP